MLTPTELPKVRRRKWGTIVSILTLAGSVTLLAGLTFRGQNRILDNRELVMAVMRDNRPRAFALLDRGLDPNLRYVDLYRPTVWETTRWEWLRLTQHKRNAFDFGPKTPTLLIIAVTNRDADLAQRLVTRGANVNTRGYRFHRRKDFTGHLGFGYDAEETTPLIEAARNDDVDAAKVLLASGADPHATSGFGQPAAYYVDRVNFARAAEMLRILAASHPSPRH